MENVLEPFYIPMESFIQWINSRKKTDKNCRNANKKTKYKVDRKKFAHYNPEFDTKTGSIHCAPMD